MVKLVLKVFKGTDKDMKCRGMQYELGKKVVSDDAVRCGSKGFHSCESPLNVFSYYPPANNRFFEAEADGKIDRCDDDSKIASSELTLKAEIGIVGLVKAHIEYTKQRCTMENTDPKMATAGFRGAATAGDYGAATAGDSGAATAGSYGAATSKGKSSVGKNGLAVARGNDVMVRGGLGAVIVIAEENENDCEIKEWKAVVVDGKKIKVDTWYKLENGEFVEVSDES